MTTTTVRKHTRKVKGRTVRVKQHTRHTKPYLELQRIKRLRETPFTDEWREKRSNPIVQKIFERELLEQRKPRKRMSKERYRKSKLLRGETEKTLQFLADTDIELYGKVTPSTKKAFRVQGVKFKPEQGKIVTTKIKYYDKKTGNYSLRFKDPKTGRMSGLHIENKFKGNHIKNINRMIAIYKGRNEIHYEAWCGETIERLKKMKKGKFKEIGD